MTDTTDIKALRELLCHEGLESDYHVGVTVTTLRLLLSKADQLEAERQRADDNSAECQRQASKVGRIKHELNKAEAEIAALKGDQVPVAVIQFSKHRKLPDGSKPDWNEMPKVVSCNWIPDGTYNVYLHPQVPVNLENVGYVQVDEGTFYLDESGVHAAIEVAGGIVKDGE